MVKKLFRSKKNRFLFGVCGGIGEYYDIDPTIIRLLWLFFILMGGSGILAYFIAVLLIPEDKTLK